MSSHIPMSVMSVAECALWLMLALAFWKKGFARRFPAMAAYLGLHAIAAPVLAALLVLSRQPAKASLFVAYFFGYNAVYFCSAALILFVCLEVFRSALSAFPGLQKIGIVIFRWVALISAIVAFSSISFHHKGTVLLLDIAGAIMRSVSLLELCLLAFLFLSMNALRIAFHDMALGIALGFGLMLGNDFIVASLINQDTPTMTSPIELLYQSLVLFYLAVWLTYCLLPARAFKPLILPANSAIYRWNEIASALGHHGTKVAPQQIGNGFFLTDVEMVVDKVLNRNLKDRKSES